MIFFSNFLALTIKAEVASANSSGSAVYSVVLVVANALFFLAIFGNSWAAAKLTLKTSDAAVRIAILLLCRHCVDDVDGRACRPAGLLLPGGRTLFFFVSFELSCLRSGYFGGPGHRGVSSRFAPTCPHPFVSAPA